MVNLAIIKELVKKKNITLKSLASQVGITEQGLHKMIKDNSASAETLDKIAHILKVSPAIFFQDSTKVESHPMSAQDITDSILGNNNHHINSSAVLMKALDEISEHRKLFSDSHKVLTEITKAVVKHLDK